MAWYIPIKKKIMKKNKDEIQYTSLQKKAMHLRLQSLSLSQGLKQGSFQSLYKSQGIEFSGVREYLPGDDIRSIDWNVTARMGRTFVKTYEEERDLHVFIILDASLSMATGTNGLSRLEKAKEVASLLSFACEHISSPLGSVIFGASILFSCGQKSGKEHTMYLLSKISKTGLDDTRGSALTNALRGAANLLKRRSLVFVISDFRVGDYEGDLSRLALKHDLVAIRLSDESDFHFPSMGSVPFVDPESLERQDFPLSSASFKKAWRDYGMAHIELWRKMCKKRGVKTIEMSLQDDSLLVLERFFSVVRKK